MKKLKKDEDTIVCNMCFDKKLKGTLRFIKYIYIYIYIFEYFVNHILIIKIKFNYLYDLIFLSGI